MKYTVSFFLLFWTFSGQAEIRLPRVISDGIVFQRNQPTSIWGWADVGEKVEITLGKEKYQTSTDASGRWSVSLPARAAGGPFVIQLKGKSQTLILRDVLFGDVWFCSGQSNMVLPMERLKEKYPKEIAQAQYPTIRHFFVPTQIGLTTDIPATQWKSVNPKDVLSMGGVTFFYARALQQAEPGVPIGIINASVGGTPIESWTSPLGLTQFPDLLARYQKNQDTLWVQSQLKANRLGHLSRNDSGQKGKWASPDYIPTGWKTFQIPGYWEDQGIKDLDGVVWFRREVWLPDSLAGKNGKLFLGRIVDADQAFWNGELVGNTTYQYPPRRYTIPADLMKAGKNILVVRVVNERGKGGFVPEKNYELQVGTQRFDLRGDWQYQIGEVFPPNIDYPGFSRQNQPASLFQGMVEPFLSLAFKGILWYQGESNVARAARYGDQLKALIKDWRNQFKQPNLPFLYVQLANFQEETFWPTESAWAILREGQRKALEVPNTAMVVAIDAGEWNDIHPLDKQTIGERLAKAARKLVYGDAILATGPVVTSVHRQENRLVVNLDSTSGTLEIPERWEGFEVAGPNRIFFPAEVKWVNNQMQVMSNQVSAPVYIRYAWADNPARANFRNTTGWPASPFELSIPEEKLPWRGQQAAVVLTYDDGLHTHLDRVIPALDDRGLVGTFYLPGNAPTLPSKIDEWRQAARRGHELGNHTLFHPCDATQEGMSWVPPSYNLAQYTRRRLVDEVAVSQTLLQSIDEKKYRTLALTCGHTQDAEGSFVADLPNTVTAIRSVRKNIPLYKDLDLRDVPAYMVNGETGEQLIEWVKEAQEKSGLLVLLFHGVGGEHILDVSLEAHQMLLDYLKTNEKSIWTTTLEELASHIKSKPFTK